MQKLRINYLHTSNIEKWTQKSYFKRKLPKDVYYKRGMFSRNMIDTNVALAVTNPLPETSTICSSQLPCYKAGKRKHKSKRRKFSIRPFTIKCNKNQKLSSLGFSEIRNKYRKPKINYPFWRFVVLIGRKLNRTRTWNKFKNEQEQLKSAQQNIRSPVVEQLQLIITLTQPNLTTHPHKCITAKEEEQMMREVTEERSPFKVSEFESPFFIRV